MCSFGMDRTPVAGHSIAGMRARAVSSCSAEQDPNNGHDEDFGSKQRQAFKDNVQRSKTSELEEIYGEFPDGSEFPDGEEQRHNFQNKGARGRSNTASFEGTSTRKSQSNHNCWKI